MDNIEKIGGFTINLKNYSGNDLYSDGDIEDELLRICQSGDREEVLRNSDSWPLLYHLSKARENILDWYEFNPEGDLLEIGAGCGA